MGKENVKAVMDVIDSAKKRKLEEELQRAELLKAREREFERECASSSASGFAFDETLAPAPGGLFRAPAPLVQLQNAAFASGISPSSKRISRSGCVGSSAAPEVRLLKETSDIQWKNALSANETGCSAKNVEESNTKEEERRESNDKAQCDEVESAQDWAVVQEATDFTMIPKHLDHLFETHDREGAVRSTILKISDRWTRKRQEDLLSRLERHHLGKEDRKSEKNKAFDLLDALSLSGALPISCAELHVVVAVTHRFENDVMGTVIQDNINPIEKVEKSLLLLASTIHGMKSCTKLISTEECRQRLTISFPELQEN